MLEISDTYLSTPTSALIGDWLSSGVLAYVVGTTRQTDLLHAIVAGCAIVLKLLRVEQGS